MSKNFSLCIAIGLVFLGFVVVYLLYTPTIDKNNIEEEKFASKGLNNATILTDSQKSTFLQFKMRMKTAIEKESYLKFDVFLLKWLQAADFDIEKAEKLLNENLKWKHENNIAGIHDEDFSDVSNDYEFYTKGEDNQGRPVLFMNLGAWDIRKAVKSGKKDRLIRYITKRKDEISNTVYKKYELTGQVTQYWILCQLKDYSFFKGICIQCTDVYLELARLLEHRYPKMSFQTITTNTPGIFSIIINLIKPILSADTKKNMHNLGGPKEYEPWLRKLGVLHLVDSANKKFQT